MADRKITDLTALAAGSQATGDLLTIVDVSESAAADKNKKITVESLFQGIPSDVGIGIASPAERLHVYHPTGNVNAVIESGDANAYLSFKDSSTTSTSHVYLGAAGNAMQFATGTVERMRIDSDGRLKIGTSSTTGNQNDADLLVVGSTQGELYLGRGSTPGNSGSGLGFIKFTGNNGQDAAEITCFSDGGTWTNGSSHPTSLRFTTTADGASSPTERVRIDNSGRVGINETALSSFNSIADDLVISQSSGSAGITIRSSTSGSGTLAFTDGANTSFQGDIRYVHNGDYMRFTTDGDERMRLTSDGKLGIGTTSPSVLLHVNESTGAHANLILENSEGSAKLGTNSNIFYVESSQHIFYNSGGSSEYARIDSAGDVLIGATSGAGNRLYVVDSFTDSFVDPGDAVLRVENANTSGTSTQASISFTSKTSGSNADSAIVSQAEDGSGNAALQFWTDTSNGMSEKARIDSGGRLLVGKSSADLSNCKLEVTGASNTNFISILNESASDLDGNRYSKLFFRGTQSGGETSTLCSVQSGHDGTADDQKGRLVFHTNDGNDGDTPKERVRISANGRFSAYSDSDTVFAVRNAGTATGSAAFAVYNNSTSTTTGSVKCVIRQDGDLENTNNSYGALSDVKLKENIVDAASQWDDLKAIQVRKYNFKEETGHETHTQIGVIAQEIETVSPGLVSESPDLDDEDNDLGTVTKSVNYSVLYMKAVKALQEAMDRIETLEAKVAALEAQ
jgi:hypothetical protein